MWRGIVSVYGAFFELCRAEEVKRRVSPGRIVEPVDIAGNGGFRFGKTEAQFSKIKPHLPTDTRGKARIDDRRVISGIVQVLKSGARWVDAPPEYGPRKTLRPSHLELKLISL